MDWVVEGAKQGLAESKIVPCLPVVKIFLPAVKNALPILKTSLPAVVTILLTALRVPLPVVTIRLPVVEMYLPGMKALDVPAHREAVVHFRLNVAD